MIREKDITPFYYKGKRILLEFVSCNHNMNLYRTGNTYIEDGYLYNVWSRYFGYNSGYKLHRKLKIFETDSHGKYVVCQGVRCYCVGLCKELENK